MAARVTILSGLMLISAGSATMACSDTDSVLAHFNTVQQAYIEAAPSMKPEDFAIWSDALDRFGAAMGEQNFAASCQALDEAAVDLGFGVAAAPTSTIGGAVAAPRTPAAAQPVSAARHCPRARCATWRFRF